jgi:lactate dehydrogenase-like 2-hydroxyacid dehydrogenase
MTAEIAMIGAQRPVVQQALEREFTVHKAHEAPDMLAALAPLADRVRCVVTNAMAGMTREVIQALPKLELCAIMGVGLEKTDLVAAKEHGVTVTTTPVLYDDVSDLAVILGMTACRRIVQADRFVREGKWLEGRFNPATKFSRKKAGILGLGRIGVALARRLEGFGMTIGYYDPLPKEGLAYQAYPSAVALAADSDLLFLAAAGGQGGAHIVTKEVLDALGPSGVFVNVARGWLVDEPALVSALVEGRIGAAGLDVFEHEPKVPSELLSLDNVVLTPHIASNTEETMTDMGDCVLANIRSWAAGKGPATPVVY